ncbi:MAG: hypothetical protein ABIL09_21980 [Gemmatimonadota bacterium]
MATRMELHYPTSFPRNVGEPVFAGPVRGYDGTADGYSPEPAIGAAATGTDTGRRNQ